MKIVRYTDLNGEIGFGAVQADGSCLKIEGDIFGEFETTDRYVDVGKLLAPVVPRTILCIGLNYRKHAEETGAKLPQFPVVFHKSGNALQHPGDPILLPTALRSDEVDYECELVVVIGRVCKNVSREDALDYVLGYTCGNDVSARDWQKKWGGGQWCRAKSFDTFGPLGPCLVTREDIPDPNKLSIRTELNGKTVQESNTGDMIFDVPALIEFLSGSTTLLPGTVIFTGTPEGVGMARNPPVYLKAGDTVTVQVEGIGELTNPVEEEQAGVEPR